MSNTNTIPDAPKILLVRLSALGDIIHTLPILAALRERYSKSIIDWLVEPGGVQLLQGHPMLNNLYVVPRKAWRENKWSALKGPYRELLKTLSTRRYDIVIDAQGLAKSAFWGWLAHIPKRIGFGWRHSREMSSLLATDRIAPSSSVKHVVRKNLALLNPLGFNLEALPNDEIIFPIHFPKDALEKADSLLGESTIPLVIMNPGAGWKTKIWDPRRYGQLATQLHNRLKVRIAIAWGPGEQPLVESALLESGQRLCVPLETLTHVPSEQGIYALPATRFLELGAVIRKAALFIGGDTGPTHLAAALGIPTICMMGPLDAQRNGPFGTHSLTIQHGIPKPAPWLRNHRTWCDPLTDLTHITVDEIFQPCLKVLER